MKVKIEKREKKLFRVFSNNNKALKGGVEKV